MMHKGNYKKLVRFLESRGYNVEIKIEKRHLPYILAPYTVYNVTGKGIVACFCTPNNQNYRVLNGRIAADNAKCFDKWSKAPVVMNISGIDYDKLLSQLEFLATEEGLDLSDSFEYDKFVRETG